MSCIVIKRFQIFEAEIEESEKAGNKTQGHLVCAASTLPLSYDNWTTTIIYTYMYCTGKTEMPQLHI